MKNYEETIDFSSCIEPTCVYLDDSLPIKAPISARIL